MSKHAISILTALSAAVLGVLLVSVVAKVRLTIERETRLDTTTVEVRTAAFVLEAGVAQFVCVHGYRNPTHIPAELPKTTISKSFEFEATQLPSSLGFCLALRVDRFSPASFWRARRGAWPFPA